MGQYKNVWKLLPQMFFTLVFVLIFTCALISYLRQPYDYIEEKSPIISLEQTWYLEEPDGSRREVSLPYVRSKGDSRYVVLVSTVPDFVEDNKALFIRCDQEDVRIFIDGEERLSYSTKDHRDYGKTSPRRYLLLNTWESDAGKEMRLEMDCPLITVGRLEVLSYGDRLDMMNALIAKNIGDACVGVFILLLCIICFLLSVMVSCYYKTVIEVMHMALLGIITSVWILCNSEICQMYFTNRSISVVMDYFMLVLMPYPFLFFMNRVQKKRFGSWYLVAEFITMAESAICIHLQTLGIRDLEESFSIITGTLVLDLTMILVTILIDIVKYRNRSYLLIAFGMFAGLFSAIVQLALFRFRIYRFGGDSVAIGLLILLSTTIIESTKRVQGIEMERQLAVARSEAEASFLASMSHEIRTPLNAVLGMNELILRESEEGQIREYAENIENSGNMLLSIINDILDFSKIRSGKMDIIEEKYQLYDLLQNVIEMIRPKAEAKSLEFRQEIAEDMPNQLRGDEVRIKQIIINMLTNAVKYTVEGYVGLGVCQKQTEDGRQLLEIKVCDSGKGIRKEDQATLFDAFSRADEKNNRNIEGTGLGLALVKKLVDAMDGEIFLESSYGKGSVFTVMIPQEKWGEQTVGEAGKRVHRVQKKGKSATFTAPDGRILVVDDNKTNLAVMKGLLKRTALQVTMVGSGMACLEKLRESHFDIVLLDHLMPGMDGVETLQEIQKAQLGKDTVIIALTANAVGDAREQYLSFGFDDYLAKPVKPAELEGLLLEHLPENKVQMQHVDEL